MILVTTAGKVGAEAARLLAERGEPVRVLVRDPKKATALAEASRETMLPRWLPMMGYMLGAGMAIYIK